MLLPFYERLTCDSGSRFNRTCPKSTYIYTKAHIKLDLQQKSDCCWQENCHVTDKSEAVAHGQ
jgi:hypothetical protein